MYREGRGEDQQEDEIRYNSAIFEEMVKRMEAEEQD